MLEKYKGKMSHFGDGSDTAGKEGKGIQAKVEVCGWCLRPQGWACE